MSPTLDLSSGVSLPAVTELYPRLLDQLRQLLSKPAWAGARLVGVCSGGVWLMQRLLADLQAEGVLDASHEAAWVSSTLHRDDYAARGLSKTARDEGSHLPFSVQACPIVLIDDVLQSGRTVRAVINELYDFGRPSRIALAVLVDRFDGRELPIAADATAWSVELPVQQRLAVVRQELSAGCDPAHFTLQLHLR